MSGLSHGDDKVARQNANLVCVLVEAVALVVQIHLQQNRTDLAVKEVAAARRWAQDSLLVNLAESWVGLRLVGSTSRRSVGQPGINVAKYRSANTCQ